LKEMQHRNIVRYFDEWWWVMSCVSYTDYYDLWNWCTK
jgi:hypothetical protein